MSKHASPSEQGGTPEALHNLKRSAPNTWAAGFPGITNAMKFIAREPGFVRGNRLLLKLNQKHGFDCPSCAWPDPKDRSTFEFCENGAKAMAWETTTKRVGREFFSVHSVEALRSQSDHWLESQGRLTEPMVLRPGSDHYEPIEWDAAFSLLGEHLNDLPTPDEAIFYTSGRTSNEAAFVYQLFVRAFGTNNLPDCSNMCHESSGAGLGTTIGVGKGTVLLEDFDEAEAIFLLGQNPGTNHPRMLSALQRAAENGCEIVAVNPLKEAGLQGFAHPQQLKGVLGRPTTLASLYLQVRINGDQAFLQGLGKTLLEREERHPRNHSGYGIHRSVHRGIRFLEGWHHITRLG